MYFSWQVLGPTPPAQYLSPQGDFNSPALDRTIPVLLMVRFAAVNDGARYRHVSEYRASPRLQPIVATWSQLGSI
jgi:hypothetical protein